jgi:ubiquinone/menaquinone biosynthesis C-methylase UbiE
VLISRHAIRPPLYDQIGTHYDVTRRADAYIVGRLIHHLRVESAGTYLDVACGTGNYTVAVANVGGHVYGIDQSPGMIAAARAKGRAVTWHLGDVEALPFRESVFSGVLCTLAIHHFRALLPVFREVFRVLARGRWVLFTSTAEQMHGYWLKAYFPTAR